MKESFSRVLLGDTNKITSLRQLREHLLNILLTSTAFIAPAMYAISLKLVINLGIKGISIFFVSLYAWLLVILFVRRIPYWMRACSLVIVFYALGVIDLFLSGPGINAGLLFLAFVAMTTLLVGLRSGLAALLLSSITVAIVGIFTFNVFISPEVGSLQIGSAHWISGGIVFLLMGILLSTSIATLINSLESGLIKVSSLAYELHQAYDALQANEERFRAMIEDSADIVSILSREGAVQYISPCVERILGYKKEELIGAKIYNYLHPDDINIVVSALTPGIPPEEIGPSLELRLRHKDGSWRTLEVRGKEMHSNPAVNGTVVIGHDITERKQTEKALQESHQLLAMVFASLNDAVFVLDAKTSLYQDCNPAASNIFGYSREEILGQTPTFLFTDPDAREEFRRRLFSVLEERGFLSNFEFPMKRKDGTIFPAELNVVPLDDLKAGRIGWVSVVHDLTERKRLEEQLQKVNEGLELQVASKTHELQERERIQHVILEATDQSIMMTDMNGKILMANGVAAKRFKMTSKDFQGICIFDLMPAELVHSRRAVGKKVVQTGKPFYFYDEGEGLRNEGNIYPIINPEGQIDRLVIFARDITAQKKTELALQASEEMYRTLAEAAQDMIFIIDADDKILYVNTFAAHQLGREPEQMIGKSHSDHFPAEIASRQHQGILDTIQSGKPKYEEQWSKFGLDKEIFISTWLVPLHIPSLRTPAILGVSRDITDLKKAERELLILNNKLETRVRERTRELESVSQKLRTLTKLLINAQEEERQRISRELHDDTSQVLVTLKYGLAELLNELPTQHGVLYERISDSIKVTDAVMASIGTLAHSLRPPLLDAGGLDVSLKDFCQDFSHRSKIKVIYAGVELDNLSEDISVTLYRFNQECFTNILKHSQATRVNVKLQLLRQKIILSVSDNGVGIRDPQDTSGIGLIGLRERIGFLGGELQIKASPGKGTMIKATIPWKGSDKKV